MDIEELERRVIACENEIKEIQKTQNKTDVEQAKINTKLDNVLVTLGRVEATVETLKDRPSKWWDKLIAALIGAAASGLIAYFLK